MNPTNAKPGRPEDDEELRRMIKETHLAVVGNEALGVTGVITRLSKVERKQRWIMFYATIIGAAVISNLVGFKQFLIGLFKP